MSYLYKLSQDFIPSWEAWVDGVIIGTIDSAQILLQQTFENENIFNTMLAVLSGNVDILGMLMF